MASEKFCLRWNDFENNISLAFRELREKKDFFDVTISCDDEQVQAHKVILSACSTFFCNILRRNPHQHPLLYLRGVKFSDLLSVLNFMYHGEVNIVQEDLNSFLSVAEDLKVKGLTSQTQSAGLHTEQIKSISNSKASKPIPPRHFEQGADAPMKIAGHEENDVEEIVPVKMEQCEQYQTNELVPSMSGSRSHFLSNSVGKSALAMANHEDYTLSYENYDNYGGQEHQYDESELYNTENYAGGSIQDLLIEIKTLEGKTLWKCDLCSKEFPHKCSGRRHIENVHWEAPTYECDLCGKVLKNKNTYQNHLNITHGIQSRPGNKSKKQ